ncbi:MAG: hypothetical protein ACI841_003066 [Planctomycetota bacterium]|jgi:hypothetical protein
MGRRPTIPLVTGSADLNGDGQPAFAVTAPNSDFTGPNSGSAHVITLTAPDITINFELDAGGRHLPNGTAIDASFLTT